MDDEPEQAWSLSDPRCAVAVRRLVDPTASPEEQLIAAEIWSKRADEFAEALSLLAPTERTVIQEIHLADRPIPIERLAEALDHTPRRARSLESRTLARLFASCNPGGGPVLYAGRRLRVAASVATATCNRDSCEMRPSADEVAPIDAEDRDVRATPQWHAG
jgi:hypothetical protein